MASQLVVDFVQKHIAIAPDRLKSYTENSTGGKYPHRWAFVRLDKLLRDFLAGKQENRWIVMPGLRGVGKTTLLAQVYFQALRTYNIPQQQMLFIPTEEVVKLLQAKLYDIFPAYEALKGQALESMTEKLIVLIDEVHYDKDWAITLKTIFDRTKNVFVICTGSSALALQTNTDVARRVQIERIFPLSFAEYRMLKWNVHPVTGLKDRLQEALLNSRDAKECFEKLQAEEKNARGYWATVKPFDEEKYFTEGTLAFAIPFDKREEIYQRIKNILDKLIRDDLTTIKSFDKAVLDKAWKLLLRLADANISSHDNLCSDIGVSKPTLIDLLDAFTRAELIFQIPAFGSVPTQVRKSLKYCFLAPAIKATLLNEVGKLEPTKQELLGQFLEDSIALSLYRSMQTKGYIEQVTYDSAEHGADFIVKNRQYDKPLVIEIGLGKKNDGIDQTKASMEKSGARYGIIAADTSLQLIDDNIIRVPRSFLMLI
jgi:hypothetical protein